MEIVFSIGISQSSPYSLIVSSMIDEGTVSSSSSLVSDSTMLSNARDDNFSSVTKVLTLNCNPIIFLPTIVR